VERIRGRSERNFAGSREPNPILELFGEEVKQELEELRDFLKRTAPKRSFPFVVRALDRVHEEPHFLDFFLSPFEFPEEESSTRSPSEKLPPGFDTEPVQDDLEGFADHPEVWRRQPSEDNPEIAEGERR